MLEGATQCRRLMSATMAPEIAAQGLRLQLGQRDTKARQYIKGPLEGRVD